MLAPQEQQTINYYESQGQEWLAQQNTQSFWTAEMEIFTKLLPVGNILELGAGDGKDAQHLITHGYGYTGIDLSEVFLTIAKKNNPGANFVQTSLYDLPFQPASFDGFFAAAVFLHVPKNRIDQAMNALKQVLKPNAIGFISLKEGFGESVDETTERFFAYYQADEFKEILAKHNFSIIQITSRVEAKRVKIHSWISFFVTYQPKCP